MQKKQLNARVLVNVVVFTLIVLVILLARKDIVEAWQLLGQTNLWIFALIVPVQFLSYYASGETIFSYLRQMGELKDVKNGEAAAMALELNFMNHIAPSAGVSGAAYMNWRLGKLGVSQSRATLAQVVKALMTFVAYVLLIMVAVLAITYDGSLGRATILASSALASLTIIGAMLSIWLVGSLERLHKFGGWFDFWLNGKLARLLKRDAPIWRRESIDVFFDGLHEDYLVIRRNPKLLRKPLLWSLVFNAAETAMFFISFWALGQIVNPAPILVGLGLAGIVGMFMATPGGAGGYELVLITFLATAGIAASVASAGVLLTRVSLILLTIASGSYMVHRAQRIHGKAPDHS